MVTAHEQPASSPPTKWQRTCRWLKRVTTFLWGTIIVGFFINVVSTISTSTTDTPLSKLLVVHWILTYPLPIISGAAVFLLLTVVSWIGSREHKASSFLTPDQQSRLILLKSLRKAYTDELDSSLQGMARIALGLHERFDLTHHAQFSSWRPGQSERALTDGTTIVDAYDQAGNGLLILGEPGAGKSTLLYDLAQELLSKAELDEQQPLPVILNLSSWATGRLPLEQWLVEELQRRYLIPRQQGQRWLQQAKLLPLLDGLDEVAAAARDACTEAINTYHSEHLVPLVVCSRREEYQRMSERLTLQSAVIIQPLSSEQVKDYLARAGEELAVVQTAMNTNPVLQELLTTPLMLSVVTLTYKDKTVKDLPHGSPEEQQRQVFEHYVTQALEKKPERRWSYDSQSTRKWLSWLAKQMQQRHLTELYLERLQPGWLDRQWWYHTLYRVVVGFLIGFVTVLPTILVSGLLVGISMGISGLITVLIVGLILGLVAGLLGGLIAGLLYHWKPRTKFEEETTWSWPQRRFIPWIMVIGLIVGLIGWINVRSAGLILSLLNGAIALVLIGLLLVHEFGTSTNRRKNNKQLEPYQNIWRSIRASVYAWLSATLFFGLLVGLLQHLPVLLHLPIFSSFTNVPQDIPFGGLILGSSLGSWAALYAGGIDCILYVTLRVFLWRSGVMPLHYVRFLEEATDRILLHHVSGGYRFIHPLFQQYFTSLYIAPPSTGIQGPPSPHP